MKVTVLHNQTLLDIAIQQYGSAEAVFILAAENQISPSQDLEAGTEVRVPEIHINKDMESYCKTNHVNPATADSTSSDVRLRIFTEEFTDQFK